MAGPANAPRPALRPGPTMGNSGGVGNYAEPVEDRTAAFDYVAAAAERLGIPWDENTDATAFYNQVEAAAPDDVELRRALQLERQALGITGTTGLAQDLRFVPEREYRRWREMTPMRSPEEDALAPPPRSDGLPTPDQSFRGLRYSPGRENQ